MTEQEFDILTLHYELEACLVMGYMPFFLSVDLIEHGNGDHTFEITIGSNRFDGMVVNDRISDVFATLKEDHIDTRDHNVYIEAFNSKEFADLIDQSFI